jgi:hypothetical protein
MPSWSQREAPPCPPHVESLSDDELLDEWLANRNNHRALVVADEMMKRLVIRRKERER